MSEFIKDKLVKAAKGIVDGKVDILTGSRYVLDLRSCLNDEDRNNSVFAAFQGFCSDMDDLGPGEGMKDCAALKSDELDEYYNQWRRYIYEACGKIINVFANVG